MKLIVIGASGFIGGEVYRLAKALDIETVGTSTQASDEFITFDMRQDFLPDVLPKKFLQGNEGVCAVITSSICNLNQCFEQQSLSTAVNITGTKRLLDYFYQSGVKGLFLSTDFVFDGKTGDYKEDDRRNPRCLYGKHKAEIEDYMQNNMPEFLIYRLSKTVGDGVEKRHLFREIYEKHLQKQDLKCIDGQVFSPTYVNDVAQYVIEGLLQDLSGIYHCANHQYMSRYELTKRLIKALRSPVGVEEVPLAYFKFQEDRPLKTFLAVGKIEKQLPMPITSMDEVIEKFIFNVRKTDF